MPPTRRKKVRLSLEDGPDVDSAPIAVRVGQEAQVFWVQETLLCSNSMFFTKALQKEWKEGETRQVNLPSIEPDVFRVWVKWVYTGRLCYAPVQSNTEYVTTWFGTDFVNCMEIYRLGDFLQNSDVKDAAIDAHVEAMFEANQYALHLGKCIYEHSNKKSAHRKLATGLVLEVWSRQAFAQEMDPPKDFYSDVFALMGLLLYQGTNPKTVQKFFRGADRCKYHDHSDEKPCYRMRPTFTL